MRDSGGGAIVNITSISGFRASTLRVAYGTSKAALAHLTRQQAAELGALGIRVNAVAPGPVDTAMAKAVHTPAIRADYHNQIPLNRYGLETELAEAIFFLCSERASYITGQTLAVDGGFEFDRHRAEDDARGGEERVGHVPEKACPALDAGWAPVFRKGHAQPGCASWRKRALPALTPQPRIRERAAARVESGCP